MKTAKYYSELAALAGQLAEKTRPEPADRCAGHLNTAAVHLRTAARLLRETAEFQSQHEDLTDTK